MRIGAHNPHIGRGWFVGVVDELLVVYNSREVSDADYAAYLVLVAREIDESDDSERRAVLYDVSYGGSTTPARRQQLVAVVKQRIAKVQRVFVASAFATSSPTARGVATALSWLYPPPIATKFVASPNEGIEWLCEKLSKPGSDAVCARYAELKTRCIAQMPA